MEITTLLELEGFRVTVLGFGDSSFIPKGSMSPHGRFLHPRLAFKELRWALCIYHIATWTVWDKVPCPRLSGFRNQCPGVLLP